MRNTSIESLAEMPGVIWSKSLRCLFQIDMDLCDPNPCQNGASCFDMQNGDYYCQCTGEYEGRNCQIEKDYCSQHICQGAAFFCDYLALYILNVCIVSKECHYPN